MTTLGNPDGAPLLPRSTDTPGPEASAGSGPSPEQEAELDALFHAPEGDASIFGRSAIECNEVRLETDPAAQKLFKAVLELMPAKLRGIVDQDNVHVYRIGDDLDGPLEIHLNLWRFTQGTEGVDGQDLWFLPRPSLLVPRDAEGSSQPGPSGPQRGRVPATATLTENTMRERDRDVEAVTAKATILIIQDPIESSCYTVEYRLGEADGSNAAGAAFPECILDRIVETGPPATYEEDPPYSYGREALDEALTDFIRDETEYELSPGERPAVSMLGREGGKSIKARVLLPPREQDDSGCEVLVICKPFLEDGKLRFVVVNPGER
jgi:hypothetical protein